MVKAVNFIRHLRQPAAPTKAGQLRQLLYAPELSFLMEAHNALSAKLVEEAGFGGIWASGLSMSAALGVRDSNEASWTQILEVLEFMSDATTGPILVDGDTGYGNFNNVRRLVKKLSQRDIAGVCLEDKLFPKTNSFIGEGQPLADIDEFCGKIKAGKDSQLDDQFCVIARVEALISGWGLEEALRRAEAYHDAGADAVLIHSKKKSPDEIFAFMREWGQRAPVVIVPTMYYTTPTQRFRDEKISTVIWANHGLRAAITAMRETYHEILEAESLMELEGRIASVRDIFDLAGNQELSQAEKRYLPQDADRPGAIVLAASRGAALGELTADQPKCMVDVRGRPLLHRLVSTLREGGIRDIAVVRGYQKDKIDLPSVATYDNDDYETTGELHSLARAADRLTGPSVITYGDILFRRYHLDNLLDTPGDIVVVADAYWQKRDVAREHRVSDLVQCSRPFTGDYLADEAPVHLEEIGDHLPPTHTHGEWVGLVKLSAAGAEMVKTALAAMADGAEGLGRKGMPDLMNHLIRQGHKPRVVYVTGHWLDVDDAFDLANARNFL